MSEQDCLGRVLKDADSGLFAVLVAGEHSESKCLGGHTSIIPIGQAFNSLRQFLPRERIIVIAQLEECRKWHLERSTSEKIDPKIVDPLRRTVQEKMWEEKKASFQETMALLVEEGGADYDGDDVNFETVLRVLRGESSERYPKVVNYCASGGTTSCGESLGKTKVFFSVFSHGNWKEETDTHYILMPYPSPTVLSILNETERNCPLPCDLFIERGEESSVPELPNAISSSIPYQPSIEQSSIHNFTPLITHHTPSGDELFSAIYGYHSIESPSGCTTIASEAGEPSSHLKSPLKPMNMHLHRNLYPVEIRNPWNAEEYSTLTTKAELDKKDSCLFHWQFLFDTLRYVVTGSLVSEILVFHQTCGSGGMWRFLNDPHYDHEFLVKSWPIATIYTAETATSAVGSSWSPFYTSLATTKSSFDPFGSPRTFTLTTSPTPLKTECAHAVTAIDVPMETEPLSCQSTLAEFFEEVSRRYYLYESTVVKYNFEMTELQRNELGIGRFGVLGIAFGDEARMSDLIVADFFS